MARRLPHAGIARPRVVASNTEITAGKLTFIDQGKPRVLVTVAPWNSNVRREVQRFLTRWGCVALGEGDALPVVELLGNRATLEIVGTGEALAQLCQLSCVRAWSYVMSTRVPVKSCGAGPDKVRPTGKPARGGKWHGANPDDYDRDPSQGVITRIVLDPLYTDGAGI